MDAEQQKAPWRVPLAGAGGAAMLGFYLYAPSFFLGTLFGVLLLAMVEALAAAYLWQIIRGSVRGSQGAEGSEEEARLAVDGGKPAQGIMWVCGSLNFPEEGGTLQSSSTGPMGSQKEELSRKGSAKKGKLEGLDVPQWRTANVKGHILTLIDGAGLEEVIDLRGCEVKVITGTFTGRQRKWSRKFPLRIRHKERFVWQSSQECFLYLPSGPLKEAWVLLLRAAAQEGNENSWYKLLKNEYASYRARCRDRYDFWHEKEFREDGVEVLDTALTGKSRKGGGGGGDAPGLRGKWLKKRFGGSKGIAEEHSESQSEEENSSQGGQPGRMKRFFGAKFGQLGSKSGAGGKQVANMKPMDSGDSWGIVGSGDEFFSHDVSMSSSGNLLDSEGGGESPNISPSPSFSGGLNQSAEGNTLKARLNVMEESGSKLSRKVDSGTEWVNAILARMFFDLHRNENVNQILQKKIQTKLASVRTPSFMGTINCTHFDLGNTPPLSKGLRVLPSETGGAVSLEADLEYYGGAKLTIETRLDMREVAFLQDKAAKGGAAPEGEIAAVAAGLLLEGAAEVIEGGGGGGGGGDGGDTNEAGTG